MPKNVNKKQPSKLDNKDYIVDVDIVIKKWNEKNPTLKPMDRETLAKDMGVGTQFFSDLKSKKKPSPKWVAIIMHLIDVGNCDLKDFIEERKSETKKA